MKMLNQREATSRRSNETSRQPTLHQPGSKESMQQTWEAIRKVRPTHTVVPLGCGGDGSGDGSAWN